MWSGQKISAYEDGKRLLLQGDSRGAFDRFKSIYMVDCLFRDVQEIVNDFYDKSEVEWVAKYQSRFGAQLGQP